MERSVSYCGVAKIESGGMRMSWEKEYPRPQLRRTHFLSLNGEWVLNGSKIKMPYPPQSKRSGYEGIIENELIYEKTFTMDELVCKTKEKWLLHFGAVDQIAEIYLNGVFIGKHEGGYLPFTFEITEALKKVNQLKVIAKDTLSKVYPYGKQSHRPKGMWYTPISGIWQSVWIEKVPVRYIDRLIHHVTMDSVKIEVIESTSNRQETSKEEGSIWLMNQEGKVILEKAFEGQMVAIDFTKENLPIHLWGPENPYLYHYRIQKGEDCVESYFGLRTIEIARVNGKQRVLLNQKPIFFHGVLDQGYFHEGIYLPDKPKGYDYDVTRMRELGYNTIRKHIKIEPERFYYACDQQGILVFQDMVNSGDYHFMTDTLLPTLGWKCKWDQFPFEKERKAFFEAHGKETIQHLYNHPCVVGYTIFNEGWGQFEADRLYKLFKKQDPSRLYDATSGWFHQKESDFESIHMYFRNKKLFSKGKPIFLSECGGYTRKISGHLYDDKQAYGYGKAESKELLTRRIEKLYNESVIPSIKEGLCGCIYTQLSDVETEINGLYTYDRKICKVGKKEMKRIAKAIKKALKATTGSKEEI